jgi:hypothetical protein
MSVVTTLPKSGINWLSGERLDRVLLTCTVALAGALFWISPRPGMVDLPQHAAQVAMLRDLLAGTSPWSDLVRINYFTPYLLGYELALALSFFMPVLTALKLILTLTYYGYVVAGIKLREEFNGDKRLDWLFVPGFFGFAYQWGFYSYLVATPLAFLFLIFAHRYARAPGVRGGLLVAFAGIGLFFSHGLVFLFACAIGAAFIPLFCRTLRQLIAALPPYLALGFLALAYNYAVHQNDLLVLGGAVNAVMWDWFSFEGWHRIFTFVLYTVATTRDDLYFLVGAAFLLVAPWLIGARLNGKNPAAGVMLVAVLIIWFCVPTDALGTSSLYQRFAIFLLPAYALAFREVAPGVEEPHSSKQHRSPDYSSFVRIAVMLFCWSYLGTLAVREHRFALASAPFEAVLAAAEPGQRALNVVMTPESTELHNQFTYLHYSVWYQVDKDGLVDFNFGVFLPEIVRFKPDRVPAAVNQAMLNRSEKFNWRAMQGRQYRYFFVRHIAPLPHDIFKNDECEVALVKEVGEWSLFERRDCR